jgi:hypothetical protein
MEPEMGARKAAERERQKAERKRARLGAKPQSAEQKI